MSEEFAGDLEERTGSLLQAAGMLVIWLQSVEKDSELVRELADVREVQDVML